MITSTINSTIAAISIGRFKRMSVFPHYFKTIVGGISGNGECAISCHSSDFLLVWEVAVIMPRRAWQRPARSTQFCVKVEYSSGLAHLFLYSASCKVSDSIISHRFAANVQIIKKFIGTCKQSGFGLHRTHDFAAILAADVDR